MDKKHDLLFKKKKKEKGGLEIRVEEDGSKMSALCLMSDNLRRAMLPIIIIL